MTPQRRAAGQRRWHAWAARQRAKRALCWVSYDGRVLAKLIAPRWLPRNRDDYRIDRARHRHRGRDRGCELRERIWQHGQVQHQQGWDDPIELAKISQSHFTARARQGRQSSPLLVPQHEQMFSGWARKRSRSRASDVTVTQVRRILCGKLILVLQAGQPILGIGRYPRLVGRLEIDPVQASGVGAEDQLLGGAIGAAKRRKAILLLHILGNLEPPHGFDLPLWRPLPNRIRAPPYLLSPPPLD